MVRCAPTSGLRLAPSALRAASSALCAAAFAFAGGAFSGCTNNGGDDAGATLSAPVGSVSLLQIERFVDGDGTSLRVVVGAKIAKYQGLEGDALLRLLGAQHLEVGSCELGGGLSTEPVSADAQVELLSVGDIGIRNAAASTTLVPRLFPALSTTASGWFYASEAELPAPRAELDEYTVHAAGELGVGAFEAVIAAPAELSELSLRDIALDGSGLFERGGDLTLTWEADDPRDRVEVELLSGGSVLSCAARDNGQLTIPSTLLTGIESDESATLIVRRVRGSSFDMQGIDASYVRVATTRTASLAVR